MPVWKYGSMEEWKYFFHKTHFINNLLKPFIHACFRLVECLFFHTSILPFFHTC
jgi:hypothetical protein